LGLLKRRQLRKVAQELKCDPLVERELWFPGRPRGKPTVSLGVISLVASSCGSYGGQIAPHAAPECTGHVATQRGRTKRLQHRQAPRVQLGVPLREQPCRYPRLPPRRGTAQAPSHEQGHPGGAHGRSNAPIAAPCLRRRYPLVSRLFVSSPWPSL